MLVACSPPKVPSLTLAPEVVELGTTGNCQVATAGLTMTNTGDVPLTLEVSWGAPFVVTPSAMTLAVGERREVSVSFDSTDRLSDVERTFEVWREGQVMATFTAKTTVVGFDFVAPHLDFAGTGVGTTSTLSLDTTMPFEVLTSSEPAFTMTWESETRALFHFSPTSAQAYAGSMRVKPASGCEFSVRLQGTGVERELAWSPSVLGFAARVGRPLNLRVDFTNHTPRAVLVRDIVVSPQGMTMSAPEFSLASHLMVPAAVGDTPGVATLEVTFTGTSVGVRNFNLRANTSLDAQPQVTIPVRAYVE